MILYDYQNIVCPTFTAEKNTCGSNKIMLGNQGIKRGYILFQNNNGPYGASIGTLLVYLSMYQAMITKTSHDLVCGDYQRFSRTPLSIWRSG